MPVPRCRPRGPSRLGAVAAGAAIGLAATLWPLVGERRDTAPTAAPRSAIARITPIVEGAPAALHVLALPAGQPDIELTVMPDRYVNEPPPASFRVPVVVRGASALGSIGPPATVTWTEGGLWYQLSSRFRTIAQLADLAGALR